MAKKKTRNRSEEAKAKGRLLRAFELTPEADRLIGEAAAALDEAEGRSNRTAALERVIREGAPRVVAAAKKKMGKIRKKGLAVD